MERIRSSSFSQRTRFYHDEDSNRLDVSGIVARGRRDYEFYVCGPNGFMDWVLDTARDAGWSEGRLHREYFAAQQADSSGDVAFEVEIASTGAVIRVAENQTVVAALAVAGIKIPTSCQQGVCGTCLVGVRSGMPEHRDMYMTPAEQARGNQFTPCCSRARSPRLVLDL